MRNNLIFAFLITFLTSSCQNDLANNLSLDETANASTLSNTSQGSCETVNYLTGDSQDVITQTKPGFVLMGGGTDVDVAFKEMIKNSGGGDFIILRSSGTDGYNPYIYSQLGGVNSVETLVIDSKEKANCLENAEKIRNAEAVFIAGGDQSKYYSFWNNSPVKNALNYLINDKKVTIGGTSAGLAILGEIVYTAEKASLNSEDVIKNPLSEKITLQKDFLNIPVLKNTITDTHFDQRSRQGRLIGFMANAIKNNLSNFSKLKAIGVDEQTAVFLDTNGIGKVLGKNNAWFFKSGSNPENYNPFNWQKSPIKTFKLKGTELGVNSFDINQWKINSGNFTEINYFIKNGTIVGE